MLNADLIRGAAAAGMYCGLETRTIYNMVENGSIPHTRKGRMLFFLKSELDACFRSPTNH